MAQKQSFNIQSDNNLITRYFMLLFVLQDKSLFPWLKSPLCVLFLVRGQTALVSAPLQLSVGLVNLLFQGFCQMLT